MLLILTLWHELSHAFVQNLAGELYKRTPPEVSVSWNDEEKATGVGESGDYMECTIWGGAVQVDRFPDPADTPSTPVRRPSFTAIYFGNAVHICVVFLLTLFKSGDRFTSELIPGRQLLSGLLPT